MTSQPTPPRVITYRGVRYHLHTGLFGLGAPAVQPDWDAAYHAAGEVQEQSRRLYRAAQELARQVGQQSTASKVLGTRVQQLLKQLVNQLKLVLQHTPS